MNAYAKSADSYLAQRVLGASPEQQAALLMEAGQRFLGKGIKAMELGQHQETSRCFIRVSEIISESICRLNLEEGGELVDNLNRIYAWWTGELMAASGAKDVARLERISSHMGEIRQAWEQLHDKNIKAFQSSGLQMRDQVV